jgi:chromosome segregation ATPase
MRSVCNDCKLRINELEKGKRMLQFDVKRLLDREQQLQKELKKQADKTTSARHARDEARAKVEKLQHRFEEVEVFLGSHGLWDEFVLTEEEAEGGSE